MNAKLNKFKIGIITFLLLTSLLFVTMSPASKAAKQPIKNWITDNIYVCYNEMKIEYDKVAAESALLPVTMIKVIPITISTRVNGYFAEYIMPYYTKSPIPSIIELSVVEAPDWCKATILPNKLGIPVSNDWQSKNINLSLVINENAFAFSTGKIKIKASASRVGAVDGITVTHDITFTPGYLPFLKINPLNNFDLVGPKDTANFDIEIENLGNAKTRVSFELLDVPEGWSAFIAQSDVIGSKITGGDSKKTFRLTVEPPYGFGYHDERGIIRVSIIPSYFGNETLKGESYLLSFIVQSKGFSTPGFELVFVLFALVAVVFIVKKRQKVNGRDYK